MAKLCITLLFAVILLGVIGTSSAFTGTIIPFLLDCAQAVLLIGLVVIVISGLKRRRTAKEQS